jgi:hypothetical protein
MFVYCTGNHTNDPNGAPMLSVSPGKPRLCSDCVEKQKAEREAAQADEEKP